MLASLIQTSGGLERDQHGMHCKCMDRRSHHVLWLTKKRSLVAVHTSPSSGRRDRPSKTGPRKGRRRRRICSVKRSTPPIRGRRRLRTLRTGCSHNEVAGSINTSEPGRFRSGFSTLADFGRQSRRSLMGLWQRAIHEDMIEDACHRVSTLLEPETVSVQARRPYAFRGWHYEERGREEF